MTVQRVSAEPTASTGDSEQTLVNSHTPQTYSKARRYVLLIIFCLAQFLDACNNTALFSAIPSLVRSLDMTEAESTWIISAFQLTFASFLLISGRISDVYDPKNAFVGGIGVLGILSLGSGFVTSKIPIIVLRALGGIAAALTIPSALTLLVRVFPEPTEQARAIGVFGGCGAIGITLGLIIGAVVVQVASWQWVFWFVAIMCAAIAIPGMVLIPKQETRMDEKAARAVGARWKTLDLVGVSIITVGVLLFIFAVTSGATSKWNSAVVLAPLIASLFLVGGFLYYETVIPTNKAVIPPRTWFLPNFLVLFTAALLPFFWWTTVFNVYTPLWQTVWHWSAISTAVHFIPVGTVAFALSFAGPLSRTVNPKWLILLGEALCIIATIILALADSPERYWPYIFPASIIGSAGTMLTYTQANIAIFRTSPPSMAGTVGALFNGALQLGSAVGISAVGSIEASVNAAHGGNDSYAGRAAAYWFLLGVVAVEFVAMLAFYRISKEGNVDSDVVVVKEVAQTGSRGEAGRDDI